MAAPIERYAADLKRDDFHRDPAQEYALQHLQRLYEELVKEQNRQQGFLERIFGRSREEDPQLVKGLYLWGGVGRGKTYLMDCFFECLPFDDKSRMHFHRFMRFVHHELKGLGEGLDPLQTIADRLRQRARVLCFDEFHVADITDAMLLGRLLAALFERGVTLVATSNQAPDKLYWDGLQRAQFLPAIELIKQYTEVIHLDGNVDYRLRTLEKAEIYHCPLDDAARVSLNASFERMASEIGTRDEVLEVEGRGIQTVRCADGLVWFEFDEICAGPRGAADYIEIGLCYHTVLVSNVPVMGGTMDDQAKRFMTMVDEFYDRNVKLIVSAMAEPGDLYTGSRHAKSFKRTVSRLQEMRTHDYLSRQHLP